MEDKIVYLIRTHKNILTCPECNTRYTLFVEKYRDEKRICAECYLKNRLKNKLLSSILSDLQVERERLW